jgi:hypothetical protein
MSHGPYRLVSAASRTTARSASIARCQGVVRDGGVVDQDVQPAVPLTHLPRRGGDAGRVGDVEGKGFGVDGPGGGRRRIGRTGGEQHNVTQLGELAAHLPADAAVAAGNQRYDAHIVDCLHIT